MPNSPRWTGTLGAQYTWHLGHDWHSTLRAHTSYQSDSYATLFNEPTSDRLRSWDITNFTLGFDNPSGGWRVQLFVRSLGKQTMGASGVVQGLLIRRIERNGLVQRRGRLLRMSRIQLNDTHPHQRLKIAGLQIELCLERLQCLLRLPGLILRDSEKEVSSRKPRVELEGVLQRLALGRGEGVAAIATALVVAGD